MRLEQSLISTIPISLFSDTIEDKNDFLSSIVYSDSTEEQQEAESLILDFLDFANVDSVEELRGEYVRIDSIADLIYKYVTRDDISLDALCDPKHKKVKRMHSDGSTEWVCVPKRIKPHHKKKRKALSADRKRKISIALKKRAKRGL